MQPILQEVIVMLNEIYEYKLYTERCTTPEEYYKKYGCRLVHKNITELNGLRRPLLIISRREISGIEENASDEDNTSIEKGMNERVAKAEDAMCSWCGFDGEESNEGGKIVATEEESNNFTLPYYLLEVLPFNDIENKDELAKKMERRIDAIKNLSNKEKSFKQNAFRVEAGEAGSDKNKIVFQEVIADALNINMPITAYYLVADCAKKAREMFPNDENANEKYIFNHVAGPLYGKDAKHDALDEKFCREATRGKYVFQDRQEVLSIIAAFLLNKRMLNETSKSVQDKYNTPIKKVDILHWIRYTSDCGTYHLDDFVIEDDGKEESLFKFDKVVNSLSGGILKVFPEWFDRCEWKIVTKEELSDLLKEPDKENTLFYRDYYFDERYSSVTKANKKKGTPEKTVYDKPQMKKYTFYYEHKSFWKKEAQDNEWIKKMYIDSFGEYPR